MSKFDLYKHMNIAENPDGSITRLLQLPTVPATVDDNGEGEGEDEDEGEGESEGEGEGVVSKDRSVNGETKTWVRIYRPSKLPSNDNAIGRLPIIIYFHCGCWIFCEPDVAMVDLNCKKLCGEVTAMVVSVSYRLAPEHRLPAQYEDAIDVLLWVKEQALDPNGEQWIREYGDFSRCYLYGISSGANIVFHTALRVLDLDLKPLMIAGLVMSQPMFGGKKRTKSEIKHATDQWIPLPALDLLWELSLPLGTDRDHTYCNPMVDGQHRKKIALLGRCLVIGFSGDLMIDRQQEFVKMLVLCGVRVEAKFDDFGFHGIDFVDANRAAAVINIIKDFI